MSAKASAMLQQAQQETKYTKLTPKRTKLPSTISQRPRFHVKNYWYSIVPKSPNPIK